MSKKVVEQVAVEEIKTEVVNTQDTSMMLSGETNEWGDVVVESKDFIMARVVLIQASSEIVKERKAFAGDFWNTLEEGIVSENGIVKLLPFYCRQTYITEKFDITSNKFKYQRQEPYAGVAKPFEEEINGEKFRHLHTYDFFCMTPDMSMPVILSFKSTSHKAGKRLFNMMYVMNKALGKIPAADWVNFTSEQESKNGNSYGVITFKKGEKSSAEDITECKKWLGVIQNSVVRVSEDVQESSTTVEPAKETRF